MESRYTQLPRQIQSWVGQGGRPPRNSEWDRRGPCGFLPAGNIAPGNTRLKVPQWPWGKGRAPWDRPLGGTVLRSSAKHQGQL